ncbi:MULTISPECIES: Crp/Fnr family transcriptional regulator [Neobacillus]|uniref:Crp/Fnr family transcriptional regulator n=1 Tax=Neobacillus citreus TaxID=2833578 RepID=A0A9J6N240_9BACI|nr:Crp/Fnr family transcriptional regulator [Neobacillus citreus]MCH6269479.1 Crp/Fnr family transcriptional regulator [Neobacillus citreus]
MERIKKLLEPNLSVIQEVDKEGLLRKIEIFKDLSPKSLNIIERRIQTLEVKKGMRIIKEDEKAKGVFFIHSGSVKLAKQDENGNEIIVCVKQQGDIFAEACLFTRKEECYPATATMLEDGRLFFLDKQELEQDLYQYPELSMQMIRYMSDALREMTSQLRDVVLLDVYAKTVKMLERLGRKFNPDFKRWEVEIPLTVQEFATVVGTSRESISRVFSKLKKEEMIDLKSRKIIILDWCKFCTLLHKEY